MFNVPRSPQLIDGCENAFSVLQIYMRLTVWAMYCRTVWVLVHNKLASHPLEFGLESMG